MSGLTSNLFTLIYVSPKRYYKDYLQNIRNPPNYTSSLTDFVPYEVRLHGIETIVTDKKFEKFWNKAGGYCVISNVTGLYINYNGSPEIGFSAYMPQITFAEREDKLREAANHFNIFVRTMSSDQSLRTILLVAFCRAFKDAGLMPKLGPSNEGPYNMGIFFETLHNEISEPTSRSREMKTHEYYPDRPRDRRLMARGRAIGQINTMVQFIMKRPSYTLTAKILNAIRPDIGPFSNDDVRKYVARRKKPEPEE